jgi:large subunit ribosomal protein L33
MRRRFHVYGTESNMAKKAVGRTVIFLECTTCRNSGIPGVNRYVTQKNKKNTASRIELSKYCRYERKVTPHKETK